MSDAKRRWNERYAAKELVWSSGPNALFAEQVKDLTPGSALDVACGEGRNTIWLAENGWQATGVDFSDTGIAKANKLAQLRGVNPHFVVGDLTNERFAAHAYDLVAILYVHTSQKERSIWLPAVIEAVKPGGVLLYIGHDPQNISLGVGGPQDPSVLPNADEIAAQLDGFDVLHADVFERVVDAEPGHGGQKGVALDTFVRARRRQA